MSHLAAWIHTPFAQALGWTLVHFVWEGAALAAMLMAGLWLLRPAPARRRYALACTILAAMPLIFAATLAVMWWLQPAPAAPISWTPLTGPPATSAMVLPPAPAPGFTLADILDRLPWLAPFWIVGVLFFYVRGVAGWAAVERLRHRGVCAPVPEWQVRLNELAARLRLARPVVLLESCFADTPVLIGYLRPVVLLPLGCLTGLSAGQVECILLHELAHAGRRDYLVNLLQSVVEGLLFYHPAVWWASRVVRAERENCCDDTVVEIMGDARSYAATLAALEQRRAVAPQAALAATGGNLMKRIRRLTMEPRRAQSSVAPAASAGLLLAIFAAGLAAVPAKLPMVRRPRIAMPAAGVALDAAPSQSAAANAQDNQPAMAAPYRKWLTEDVAYIITDSERAAFGQLETDVERENFIEQFWKLRDPTPDTVENEFKEEHYRRIAYANGHFASAIPGWKTDRGRIYITYGPPDEIDDHSLGGNYQRPPDEGGGVTSTYPFQQWRYRYIEGIGANVIVEFVDSTGSGEFHMTMDPSEKDALLARRPQAAAVAGGAFAAAKPRIAAADPQHEVPAIPAPYRRWLNEDVAYIVTNEERSAFKNLKTDGERETFIEQFWQRRDPTPGTARNEFKEEHYRRIAYTNLHFTDPAGLPGWKTDLGRIYIMYGPPDSVTQTGTRSISWTYRFIEGIGSDVTLVFEDSQGNGEFHLTMDPGAPHADPGK